MRPGRCTAHSAASPVLYACHTTFAMTVFTSQNVAHLLFHLHDDPTGYTVKSPAGCRLCQQHATRGSGRSHWPGSAALLRLRGGSVGAEFQVCRDMVPQ